MKVEFYPPSSHFPHFHQYDAIAQEIHTSESHHRLIVYLLFVIEVSTHSCPIIDFRLANWRWTVLSLASSLPVVVVKDHGCEVDIVPCKHSISYQYHWFNCDLYRKAPSTTYLANCSEKTSAAAYPLLMTPIYRLRGFSASGLRGELASKETIRLCFDMWWYILEFHKRDEP